MDKSQYFSILKQLHDICRNNPAPKLTGMDAYNEIINFLFLRHESDLNNDSILESLYKKYCTDECILKDYEDRDLIHSKSGIEYNPYYKQLSKKLLPNLIDNKKNKDIAFVKILGENITTLKLDIGRLTNLIDKENGENGQKAQKIINKLYSDDFLPLNNDGKFDIKVFPYDALGEGFEKFMGDSGSTGGNWGQYFTNIQVIDWIIIKINISKHDKIIDPFAGSGGFILQVKKKYNLSANNIYAQEFDDKIFKFLNFNSKIAGLNLNNISKCDSFDYHQSLKENKNKFDKIITNPPFGESVDIFLTEDDKRKYWSFMKTGKMTIKASMGLAVYTIIKSLKNDGVAGFVTDRGILNNGTENNSWHKKLRKHMIETCDISEILLLPKGIFSHTTFDTACIIMKKGTPTKEIRFHQGYFKDEDKGTSNKKMYIKEDILKITFKDIVNKDWSLKYDDYIEKEEMSYNGIQYKALGEVCEFKFGNRITKSKDEVKSDYEGNKYPVYGGGDITFYTNQYNREGKTLVISRFGVSPKCVRLINDKFWLNDSGLYIEKFNINQDYLSNFLIVNQNNIYIKYTSGQAQKNMETTKLFRELKIPMLPTDHQQRIVDFMDKFIGEDYNKLDKIISKFKDIDLFKLLLKEDYEGFKKIFEYYDELVFTEKQLVKLEKEHY
jgi:type I restriction-modification system DNA methylase subunit